MSARDTYSLAHTARCKLQLAADRPDRNLRFILGHAFTLDKIRLRLAEIEIESSDDEYSEEKGVFRERRVSFRGNSPRPTASNDRKRSPPPDQFAHLEETDSESSEEEDEADDEDEDEDEGLSLRRFESGSARPPQMIDDDESSSSDEDEPKSPPPLSEEELKMITGRAGDAELSGAYQHISNCPCHGQHHEAPRASNVWEIPQKAGHNGPRLALVQVTA